MKSMPNLTKDDQLRVQHFARQAAGWLGLFQCITPAAPVPRPVINRDDRLDIIWALHHLTDFRDYVHPFLKHDERITEFEDAVAEAVYCAALERTGN